MPTMDDILGTMMGGAKLAGRALGSITLDREQTARDKIAQQRAKQREQQFLLSSVKGHEELLAHPAIGKAYDQALGTPGAHELVLAQVAANMQRFGMKPPAAPNTNNESPGVRTMGANETIGGNIQDITTGKVPFRSAPAPQATAQATAPGAAAGGGANDLPVGATLSGINLGGGQKGSLAGPTRTEAREQAFFDVFNQTRDGLEQRGMTEGDAIAEGVRAAARVTGSVPAGFREAFMAPYTQQMQLGTEAGRQQIQLHMAGPKAAAAKAGSESVPVRPAPAERKVLGDAQASIDAFDNLRGLFDPAIQGPVAGRAARVSDIFGGNPKGRSKFLAATKDLKRQVRFAMTGAQASFAEIKDIESGLPTENDPPSVWAAKWEESAKSVLRRVNAYHETLRGSNLNVPPLRVPKTVAPLLQAPPTGGAVHVEQPAAPAAPTAPTNEGVTPGGNRYRVLGQ